MLVLTPNALNYIFYVKNVPFICEELVLFSMHDIIELISFS